jgi:hypothetical protein
MSLRSTSLCEEMRRDNLSCMSSSFSVVLEPILLSPNREADKSGQSLDCCQETNLLLLHLCAANRLLPRTTVHSRKPCTQSVFLFEGTRDSIQKIHPSHSRKQRARNRRKSKVERKKVQTSRVCDLQSHSTKVASKNGRTFQAFLAH